MNEHGNPSQPASKQTPLVTLHRGQREMGDVLVVELVLDLQILHQRAKAGPQNNRDTRVEVAQPLLQPVTGLGDLANHFISIEHVQPSWFS